MESNNREHSLHAAIEQLDIGHLRGLLTRGGDVEEKDAKGTTPLVKAVLKDSLEVVELLLNAGADVNGPFCVVGFPENMVFSVSLQNALSYAILRYVFWRVPKLTLTPVRHQIIKRLIAAGSNLDVAEQFQQIYTSPLQNACRAKLWPVVVDLIKAGSKVDIIGRSGEMPLVTAASGAGRFAYSPGMLNVLSEDAESPQSWPWREKALRSLVEISPTLMLAVNSVSLFKNVINGCSASVLCMLLKVDKPAYGIDEAVDILDYETRSSIISTAEAIHVTLGYDLLSGNRLCTPLEIAVASFFQGIHNPRWDVETRLCFIRTQFAIVRLLLDARVTVYNLDENFKQFLRLIRNRLNTDYNHDQQDTLEYYNQILNEVELRLHNPRKLREMCRTRVRYELTIRGLCVYHIRDNISHIVRDYLLYGDVPEPKAYLV